LGLNSAAINPAWSADGREIFYTDRNAPGTGFVFTLRAVNVLTRADRTLAATTGTNSGGELVAAPASGGFVFFTIAAAIGPHYVIYRVPVAGGQLDTIAKDARWPWFQVSNDGKRMAYHGGYDVIGPGGADTLKVVDATRPFGPVIRATPMNSTQMAVWSFAPDGASFVYSDGRAKLFDIATGATRVLYTPPPSSGTGAHESTSSSILWDGATPHLLVATWSDNQSATSIYDLDGSSGDRRLIGTVPVSVRAPWNLRWSPDASRVAVWVSSKSFNCSVEGCSYDGLLYLLSRSGGTAKVIFDSNGASASPTWTEFSPDGKSIAAVNFGGLYVFVP
jgi:Tol biopolymer transport system component